MDFVKAFDAKRDAIKAQLRSEHPKNYEEIFRIVVRAISNGKDDCDDEAPDPDRIVAIDHGGYQGTLVFVVASKGYQPSDYWATSVSYGSCSGCDTLQAISGYSSDPPTEEQVGEYFDLALHLLQRMRPICGYSLNED